MIFCVHDIDNYRDKLCGFYFDFENEALGPLVKSNEILIHAINQKNYPLEMYENYFKSFTKTVDGNTIIRVVEKIFVYLRK